MKTKECEKLRLFEMFAGYGGASFALKKAGLKFETVGYSEIDKYAIQCYDQNHKIKDVCYATLGIGCERYINPINFGDCTKINPNDLPDFDLLTGGFPCQSFSIAGKGLGELDTRGTLFNEIIRIAEVKQPKFMLLENVKGLISKKHKDTFDKILSELNRIGYNVHWKVINSKEYGIPQNRERVWFVCVKRFKNMGDDFKANIKFNFPEKEELKIFLKDILEDKVDEKYYLSEENTKKLLFPKENNISSFRSRNLIKGNICQTLLSGMSHGNTIPCIQIKNATKKGYLEARQGDGINLEQPNSKTRRARVQEQSIGCLQTNDQRGVVTSDMRIRKLTPTECFRLQGFLNDEINLEGLSNTQRYKLAGNGWDISLVAKIFTKMFK